MMLNELKQNKILILGFGKEGIDSFKFLRKLFPEKTIGIGDRREISDYGSKVSDILKNDKKIRLHFGENYLKATEDYDAIVKSPGIPIHLPEIEEAFKAGKITSQTEIFFENCPGRIVGITGTKGKSTTTSLIHDILKEGGIKAHLVGNIGKPALSLLEAAKPDNVYVYELSSHQLYGLKKSPHIAVLLNIYPEHLDYYENFREYSEAKMNITRCQTGEDYFIFNPEDKNIKQMSGNTAAKKIPIITNKIGKIIKIKDIPLKGSFNLLNVGAAIEAGKIFGIDKKKIAYAIKNFKPLPHRLEYVGTFKGIAFYDDALSTIPETTIAALEALGKKVQTVFLGGFDRGIDFKNLAEKILENGTKNVILFPTTGEKIWQAIRLAPLARGKNLPRHFFVDNMEDAVKLAYLWTHKGKICLLSCASTSFSIFKDYKEKGDLFKKYVKKYGKGK